jgi:hypothetical protein
MQPHSASPVFPTLDGHHHVIRRETVFADPTEIPNISRCDNYSLIGRVLKVAWATLSSAYTDSPTTIFGVVETAMGIGPEPECLLSAHIETWAVPDAKEDAVLLDKALCTQVDEWTQPEQQPALKFNSCICLRAPGGIPASPISGSQSLPTGPQLVGCLVPLI